MSIYPGNLVLLKLETFEGNYKNIGGIKITYFSINNQLIGNSNIATGRWRHLLEKAGCAYLTIKASGLFTNSITEKMIMDMAFSNQKVRLKLCFGNKDEIIGEFLISQFERGANFEEEENYNITLESSSEIKIT